MKVLKFTLSAFVFTFSLTSFADYPMSTIYECHLFGQDLNTVTAQATLDVVTIDYGKNTLSPYLRLKYLSTWDKQNFEHSVPVKKFGSDVLRFSYEYTPKDYRFSPWDKLHLTINTRKTDTVKISNKSYTGYVGKAGFSTDLRYIFAEAVCLPR